MVIQIKDEMAFPATGSICRVANRLHMTARCVLVLTAVMICLAACVAPHPLPTPEEPQEVEPAPPQPAPAALHSDLPLRSQLWFRWTGKCFETATSHMQTVGTHLVRYTNILYRVIETSFTLFKSQFEVKFRLPCLGKKQR